MPLILSFSMHITPKSGYKASDIHSVVLEEVFVVSL